MDRYTFLLLVLTWHLLLAICPSSFARQDTLWHMYRRIAQAENGIYAKVDSLNAFANHVMDIQANLADSALALARQLAFEHAYTHGEAVSLYLISHREEAHGSMKEAEKAILAAISLFEKEKLQPVSIRAYLHAGWLYRRLRERGKAMEYGIKALKLAEQAGDTVNIGNGYNQLAILYVDIEDYDRALNYHQQALLWRKRLGDNIAIAQSEGNMAIVYMRQGRYDEALAFHKKGLLAVRKVGDRSREAFFYNDIGSTYLYRGDTDSAIHYLKKSIAMREAMHETNEIAYTYNYLGEAYEKAGNILEGERWIKKALRIAIEINNTKQHQEALESLSDFYARSQLYDSAYVYLHKHKVYSDSVAQADRVTLIDELATQYETEKKEQQIEILNQETAIQRLKLRQRNLMLLAALGILVTGVAITYFIFKQRRLKTEARLQQEINTQQEKATRDVLDAEERERRRIASDLHDGVGQTLSAALLNLSYLHKSVAEGKTPDPQVMDNAVDLVKDSYQEMRSISHQMMPNALLKAGLATSIKEFLDAIDGKNIKVNLSVSGLVDRLDQQLETVLYRAVQEAVNNVVKHAQAARLTIQLMKDDEGISVTIEDNGRGFDPSGIDHAEGIGLKNIRSRVGLLQGSVDVDTAPGRGTVVVIFIPT